MINLLYSNPMRPTDAWWERSTGILQGDPKALVSRDGSRGAGWIRRAHRFQTAHAKATSDNERMRVMAHFPEIYWAHWFHKEKQCPEQSLLAYGIEARIMARQTDIDIAQGLGCWPTYIEAYEALFFNVRDRLDNRDFIFNTVLGHQAADDKHQQQYDRVWKLLAYRGGQHALDAVMCGSANFTWVQRPEDVPSFFRNLVRGTLQQKVVIASQLISPEDALSAVSSKTRRKNAKAKRGESTRVTRAKRGAQNLVEAEAKPMLFPSIPCETIGEIAGPMTFDLAERDEVRVSRSN